MPENIPLKHGTLVHDAEYFLRQRRWHDARVWLRSFEDISDEVADELYNDALERIWGYREVVSRA